MAVAYLNKERIRSQIEQWDEEEPRNDWWSWQHDFLKMFEIITEYEDVIGQEFARRCIGDDA